MKVRDIMSKDVVTIDKDQTLSFAVQRLKKKKVGRLLVAEKGKVVGILTKRDIARKLGSSRTERLTSGRTYVSSAMTKNPVKIIASEDASKAAMLMVDMKIGALPVVEGDETIGIISRTDLLGMAKKLKTPISEVMNRDVIEISPETRVTRARELMLKNEVWGLPVIDNNLLVGIITEGDVAEAFETFRRLVSSRHMPARVRTMLVKEIMSGSPVKAKPDDKVSKVATLLKKHKIDGLPVVDSKDHVLGIVTKTDIIRLL